MKTAILLLVMVLGFAGQSWGQEKEKTTTSLEQNYSTIYKKKGFWKKICCEEKCSTEKCVKNNRLFINGQINNGVKINNTNTYVIEYDFKDGVYKKNNLKLKINTPVVFKITNINRLAYDVNIGSKDSILAETFIQDDVIAMDGRSKNDNSTIEVVKNADGVITNPNVLGIEYIDDNDLIKQGSTSNKIFTDLINGIPSINKLQTEIDIKKTQLNELKEKQSTYEEKKGRLNRLLAESDSDVQQGEIDKLKEEILKEEKFIKNITQQINVKQDSIILFQKEIRTKTNKLNEYVKKFNQDNLAVQTSFNKLKKSYDIIVQLKHTYQEVAAISHDPYLSKENYIKNHKAHIEKKSQFILKNRDTLQFFKGYYNDFDVKYNYLKYNPSIKEILNYGGQIKLFSQADYLKELADGMNKDVNENKIIKMIKSLEILLSLLECDNTYEIVSAPIQPLRDVAIFDIHIVNKNDDSPITDKKKFRHREFTYGGARLDFSLGLGASYFVNTDVYELGSEDINKNGMIERETKIMKKSDYLAVPSLLGLATMSYRKTGYITFGASAGLGIDVVNGKIQLSNFFGGPTVLFGKFDRLFLTLGGSVRNVGQLKGGYRVGDVIPSGNNDIEDFITDKYKIGGFIALTYNLTKGARDNYKKLREL